MLAGTGAMFAAPFIMPMTFVWKLGFRALSKRLGGAHIMMDMDTYSNLRPCFPRKLLSS